MMRVRIITILPSLISRASGVEPLENLTVLIKASKKRNMRTLQLLNHQFSQQSTRYLHPSTKSYKKIIMSSE